MTDIFLGRTDGPVFSPTQRIVHVIAEFSGFEAMGRTVLETVARIPGEHHLVTTSAHDNQDKFASVHELGGAVGTFPIGRSQQLADVLEQIKPDLVHFHAGALAPYVAAMTDLRKHRLAVTIYAWPNLPSVKDVKRVGLASARTSNALRARVAVTNFMPAKAAAVALKRAGVSMVLSPDPRVAEKLQKHGITVIRLASGAPQDPRRASFDAERPTVLFAGRSEKVRGIPTLIDAFAITLKKVPNAKLRLLMIPRGELAEIEAHARRVIPAEALEISTSPVSDLLGEMAAAQVGVWPFELDYVTSPPAMALAEAMSVGLPTISTPVACVRAVVEPGVNGMTIPAGDSKALARDLEKLLTDEATWQKFATKGQESMQARFGWDKAAEATGAVYAAAYVTA